MNLITLIELLGTMAFAISGALAAIEKKLDPFGVLIIAFVTAIGGGTIRDMLIGDLPVAWLTQERTTLVIIGAAALTLAFGNTVQRFARILLIVDALGLGLFTLTGISKGIAQGVSPGIAIALGTITGCFGGVLRDVLLGKVPLVFQKEIYASAAILGGILFFTLLRIPTLAGLAGIIAIAAIVAIRLLAIHFNWSLPRTGRHTDEKL